MTHTPTLQPCPNPWCEAQERDGDFSPYVFRTNYGNWRVSCTSCTQEGPTAPTEAGAITAWNTRPKAIEAGAVKGVVSASQAMVRSTGEYLGGGTDTEGFAIMIRAMKHDCDVARAALSQLAEMSNEVA